VTKKDARRKSRSLDPLSPLKSKVWQNYKRNQNEWVLSGVSSADIELIRSHAYASFTQIRGIATCSRNNAKISVKHSPKENVLRRTSERILPRSPSFLPSVRHHFSYLDPQEYPPTGDVLQSPTSTMCCVDWIVERQGVLRSNLFLFFLSLLVATLSSSLSLSFSLSLSLSLSVFLNFSLFYSLVPVHCLTCSRDCNLATWPLVRSRFVIHAA